MPSEIKVHWTWQEWQAERVARKAITSKVGPAVCRRKEGSSDKRLRRAFDGKRAPN